LCCCVHLQPVYDANVDPIDSFIWRVVGPFSPSLRARLLWARPGSERVGKAVLSAVIERGDVAIDIGANVGVYTDRLARLVGREGAVYAFEPHPAYATELKGIASSRGNVTFVPAAVSDQLGTAHLSVPEAESGGTSMGSLQSRQAGVETIGVRTTTLDSELAGVSRVRLVKCDVEGHEHEVLLGGRELLVRERPVLLIEIEQRHRERPIGETFELLRSLGYHGHMFGESGLRPLAEFDVERDQLALIAADPATASPPAEYVNDFVFVPAGTSLAL